MSKCKNKYSFGIGAQKGLQIQPLHIFTSHIGHIKLAYCIQSTMGESGRNLNVKVTRDGSKNYLALRKYCQFILRAHDFPKFNKVSPSNIWELSDLVKGSLSFGLFCTNQIGGSIAVPSKCDMIFAQADHAATYVFLPWCGRRPRVRRKARGSSKTTLVCVRWKQSILD